MAAGVSEVGLMGEEVIYSEKIFVIVIVAVVL